MGGKLNSLYMLHGWKSTKTLMFSLEKVLQNSWGAS